MQRGSRHSNFFTGILQERDFSAELIRLALPSDMRGLADFGAPVVEESHYVDEELRSHQSDVLFSVPREDGGDLKLYLLFEHKSHPDKGVLMQLLRYMHRIYANQEILEPVLPIVFHHGPEDWEPPLACVPFLRLSGT